MSAEAHEYFREIEEVFVELRGSPCVLSPKDWQTAERWHDAEVPLELVLETIRAHFERRTNAEKIWYLSYFNRQVRNNWRKLQQLQAPAAPAVDEELDVADRLERLAAALPPTRVGRVAAAGIRSLTGTTEAIEERLVELDREVLSAAAESLPRTVQDEIGRELKSSIAALSGRLPAPELYRQVKKLREGLLRERLGLPVLSLFAPEACRSGSSSHDEM